MKKHLLSLLLLSTVATTAFCQQRTEPAKLSPLTQLYLLKARSLTDPKQSVQGYVYKTSSQNQLLISALVKVAPAAVNEQQLKNLGIAIGTKAGNIWTLQIPVENVEALTNVAGLSYIQLDEPVYPTLDSVRKATHVDSVHAGINLPKAFTGKNVVLGILDVGFDYSHPLFFDTTGNKYRVKKIWEQKSTGTPPTGYTYGREIVDSTVMWAIGTDNTGQSHGSHVAGIAGGSGFGSSSDNGKFRGVAFGTDVVLVGITPPPGQWQNTGMADLIDGMSYVYNYATSVGKPAVINLSWGCSVGSHDGLSLFSQAVDNLTGAGKLFACSAGNTGSDQIHVGKTFTAADTLVRTFVNFASSLSEKKTWIDVWGDSSKTFCAQVTLYNGATQGNSTGFICLDNITHNKYIIGSAGDTCFVDFFTSTSEFNGKPRIFLNIYNKSAADGVMLSIKSTTNAKVNIWEGYVESSTGYYGSFSNGSQTWAVNGDNISSISDWSATKSAIAVGAFAVKNTFTNIDANPINYTSYVSRGRIVPFSSKGPTVDGRISPFITAPGFLVGSAVSSFDASFQTGGGNYSSVLLKYQRNGRDYPYAMLSGTSMSSPVVSGILALMLEANPNLTPQQAQSILATTALQDTYTGVIPALGNNTWGHGKVNAYGAVQKVLQQLSIGNVIAKNMTWNLYPNPSTGIFKIECTTDKGTSAKLEVVDMTGKVIMSDPWKLNAGNNLTTIDLSSIAKGIYFTKLISEKGQSSIKIVLE